MHIKNYYTLIITLFFSLLFLSGNCSLAQDNCTEGINEVKGGNYIRGIDLLKTEILKNNSYECNLYYAYALFKTGSIADAERYISNAINIDNERAEAYSVLGEIYSAQKKYNDAETNFETAKKYLPLNKTKDDLTREEISTIVDVLSREAENFLAEVKVDKAITSLSMAKTYDNNNPILLTGIGDAYLTRGSYELAKTNYNSALTAKNNYAPAFYGLGRVSFSQKKYNEALDDFSKAVNADPNFADAYFEQGLILYLSEKFDLALESFKKFGELMPGSTRGKTFWAKTLYAQGKLDEAMNLLDEVLTIDPKSSEANKYKAYIYIEKKDFTSAQTYFGKVDEKGYNSEDWSKIAEIYENQKDFNKAYDCFKKSLTQDSTSETTYFEYGKAQFNNQEYDASIINFNKAIELGLGARNYGVYVYKGIAMYYLKDYENAIPQFQKSLDANPSFATSWLWIGNCYAAMGGKRQEAINSYKKCLEIDPNNQDAKDQITKLGGQ
jgi:tetratricopeptide (TPR) repeat protein